MRAGVESQTAVMVCQGRALADGELRDPTAMDLLPDDARAQVERIRRGERARGMRERMKWAWMTRQSKVTIARTIEIDRAVREAAAPQVVILGAGLDGRAWRMTELRDATVFEVDHPDSQRAKRERAARLTQVAREVKYVAVDFARDRLDERLAAAGHDPARPTTWIWEGVVMYLARADIEATLAIVGARSAPGSRLIVLYHAPALILRLVGWIVGRMGEPLRTVLRPDQMRALLAEHGFAVVRDRDLPELAAGLSREVRETTRRANHMRIVVAERGA